MEYYYCELAVYVDVFLRYKLLLSLSKLRSLSHISESTLCVIVIICVTIHLHVLFFHQPQDTYRVLSASDRNFINEIARQSGDLLTMTTYGVQSYKMRFNEGIY